MIKRQYFVSAKISHNNGTSEYSYFNGLINTIGWIESKDDLMNNSRQVVHDHIGQLVSRVTRLSDVEILAFNRI